MLGGRATDAWGHLLGCAAVIGAFACGAVLFTHLLGLPGEERVVHEVLFSWVPVGVLKVDFGLQLDALSVCFLLLITGVGALIHIYLSATCPTTRTGGGFRLPQPVRRRDAAAGARRQLPRPLHRLGGRRPGVLPADRVLVPQAQRGGAAKKAFVVNRVGDMGLAIALMVLFARSDPSRFSTVFWRRTAMSHGTLTAVGCCCCSAPAARAPRCRCSPGSATPWRAPRRCRR